MKTKDKKGMTLVEVIIAISITTIVLSVGYTILNKVNISPKVQATVSDIQNGMNNIRSLMSKEIKYCKGIEIQYTNESNKIVLKRITKNDSDGTDLDTIKKDIISKIKSEDKLTYKYNILNDGSKGSGDIENSYNIDITTKNNKKYFSIDKVDSKGVSLNLISSQLIMKDTLPMDICIKNGMYSVNINYNNNTDKKYLFKVYSEFAPESYEKDDTDLPGNGNDDNTNLPDVGGNGTNLPNDDIINGNKPPDLNQFTSYNMVGFWAADSEKVKENNMYTWIGDNKGLSKGKYSVYEGDSEKFNITAMARPGNNGYTNTYMLNSSKNVVTLDANVEDKNVSKVKIYVSAYTTLKNINIYGIQGSHPISLPNNIKSIYGGNDGEWVECIISGDNNSKVNFSFNADFSFDKNKVISGYAAILYN